MKKKEIKIEVENSNNNTIIGIQSVIIDKCPDCSAELVCPCCDDTQYKQVIKTVIHIVSADTVIEKRFSHDIYLDGGGKIVIDGIKFHYRMEGGYDVTKWTFQEPAKYGVIQHYGIITNFATTPDDSKKISIKDYFDNGEIVYVD